MLILAQNFAVFFYLFMSSAILWCWKGLEAQLYIIMLKKPMAYDLSFLIRMLGAEMSMFVVTRL